MTNTPETPALPGDLTDETIERAAAEAAALATELREHMRQQKWMPAGLAIRAADLLDALAAARVAPVTAASAYQQGWRDGLIKMAEDISGRYTLMDAGGEAWSQYRSLLRRDAEIGPDRNPFDGAVAPVTPSLDREKPHWSDLAAAAYPGDEHENYPLRTAFGRGYKAALAVPPVASEAKLIEAIEILGEVIAFYEGTATTHYEGCWKGHAGCLAVLLRDVLAPTEGNNHDEPGN